MKFSIVIPLFNEAENVLKLNSEIIEVLSGLKSTNNEFEIIYVDDSSTDNTLMILNEINNNISTKIIKNNSNLTILMVTHRLKSLAICDRLLIVKNNKVIEKDKNAFI